MRLQRRVEMAEHDARLDDGAASIGVDLEHVAKIFRAVEDQGSIDRLAALAGAAAARQDRDAALARDRHRGLDILDRARHENADGLDLVDGGVGRIAAAVGAREQHLTPRLPPESGGELRLQTRLVIMHVSQPPDCAPQGNLGLAVYLSALSWSHRPLERPRGAAVKEEMARSPCCDRRVIRPGLRGVGRERMYRLVWAAATLFLMALSFAAGRMTLGARIMPEIVATLPNDKSQFSRDSTRDFASASRSARARTS